MKTLLGNPLDHLGHLVGNNYGVSPRAIPIPSRPCSLS